MAYVSKPYTIEPPISDLLIENIDATFDLLFGLLAAAQEGVLPVIRGGTGVSRWKRGDLIYAHQPEVLRGLHAVEDGYVLISDGLNTPPVYGKVNLDGADQHVTGTLQIGYGGTGQTTKTEAFDALSPTTNFGDLIVMGGADNDRLPLGNKDQFLVVDPSAPLGVAWKTVRLSSLIDYFLLDAASDIGGYKDTSAAHSTGPQVDLDFAGLASGDTLLEEWATPSGEPAIDFLPDGIYHLHVHSTKTAGTKTAVIFFRVYKRTAGGVETLIVQSEESQELTGLEQEIDIEASAADTDIDTTDRIVVKLYATVTGVGSAPTVQIEIEGDSFSRLEFPVPGITGSSTPGGGAPTNAEYIVGALHADLSAERLLQGTTNRVSVDLATPGLATLSAPQDLHTAATPQFARLGLGAAADAAAVGKFVGQFFSPAVVHATPGAAETIDWNEGNEHSIVLEADCTISFSNPVEGGRYVLEIVQDGTGGWEPTLPAGILWPRFGPPTFSTEANRRDLITFLYRGAAYLATYSVGHRSSGYDTLPYLVDADTLDGFDSTAFARKAEDATIAGAWVFTPGLTERGRSTPIGEWTAIAYAAGNFTGSGSMTWTVEAGDQITYQYILIGKTAIIAFNIGPTTVGGTPSTRLLISNLPFTCNKTVRALCYVVDNAVYKTGAVRMQAATSQLEIFCDLTDATNWTASTNATSVICSNLIVEIQ